MRQFAPLYHTVSLILLVVFMISSNGALYGYHAADEKSHALAEHASGDRHAQVFPDHGSHQHPQEDSGGSNSEDHTSEHGEGHSHASALSAKHKIPYAPLQKDLVNAEILFSFPEVYLERFIPPQNLS